MPSPSVDIRNATFKEKARAACRRARSVVDAFDDAHVALRRIAQDTECGLVVGAVVGGDRLGEAVELDQYSALIDTGVISLGGAAAREKAPTAGEDGRSGKLGVLVQCRGVGDRAIADDPLCLGHRFLRVIGRTDHATVQQRAQRADYSSHPNRGWVAVDRSRTFDADKHRKCPLAAWLPNLLGRAERSSPKAALRRAEGAGLDGQGGGPSYHLFAAPFPHASHSGTWALPYAPI